ncbi:flagellar hook-length control protein FliK [Clostridium sp. UBA4548]|uniref:flagellar hook-length control protein FliK n=1 Tax=Clostridium sp. UBA4548 TaxID=1946361 RepID=UPI0025BF92B8|nr:flagellar hook-length control protein FliK [Clostridium sp. UBA4548]
MDISNLELSNQTSISIKNKNSNQCISKGVSENKFASFLKTDKSRKNNDSTARTNSTKDEANHLEKSFKDKKVENDTTSSTQKSKNKHNDNCTKLDESHKEEDSSDELDSLSEKHVINEETLANILNLFGLDLEQIIAMLKKSSNANEEIKNMLKLMNLEIKSKNPAEAENMMNMLTQLIGKDGKESIPSTLLNIIPSRIINELMGENNTNNSTVGKEVIGDTSNNPIETEIHNKLLESILAKLKGSKNEDFNVYNGKVRDGLFDTNGTHYNIFEEVEHKTGVETNKNLQEASSVKESDLLKKFIEGNKSDSKVDRVANFMNFLGDGNSQLNKLDANSKVPVYISKSTFSEDIVKAVKFMDLNGIKDLSVKIYPKELGEVFISVTMENGALKAAIKATSKEAVEMLSLGLRDINEKINQDNSKIQSVDISLYNEDTTFFSSGNLNQNQQQQHESEKFMKKNNIQQDMFLEEEIITEQAIHENAVNLLI